MAMKPYNLLPSSAQRMKPYNLLSSRAQRKLYKALYQIRCAGYRHIPQAEQNALGGLTDEERLSFLGVFPQGTYVSACGGRHSKAYQIPGVSIRTYEALAQRGYVMCHHGIWFALFEGEPRVAMLNTGRLA